MEEKTIMDTLPDVNTRRGGTQSSHAGLTSDVFPEVRQPQWAKDLQTGVSVRFAPDPTKKWYVLRTTYGRANKAYRLIAKDNETAYLPLHYVQKECNGKKKRILEPLLPNIIFVYATEEYVSALAKDKNQKSFISFYLNHFEIDRFGKNPPLTIDYHDMMNFIRVTSIANEHIKIVTPNQCRYKEGDRVRIIDGEFKGIEGRVARVSGQQRVVVELSGLCLLATAYIPSAFLQELSDGDATAENVIV